MSKIGKIKYFLQRYGERDDEGFHQEYKFEGREYILSMQFSFDEDGDQILESIFTGEKNGKLIPVFLDSEIGKKHVEHIIKTFG